MSALVMIPGQGRRLVLTERLVEAGLVLIRERRCSARRQWRRAVGCPQNGLLILTPGPASDPDQELCRHPIADTFINVDGRWWFTSHPKIPSRTASMNDRYPIHYRLRRYPTSKRTVWSSAVATPNTGTLGVFKPRPALSQKLGTLISKLTHETIGVDVSPHLFRTAGASTAPSMGAITRTSPARFSITEISASPRTLQSCNDF